MPVNGVVTSIGRTPSRIERIPSSSVSIVEPPTPKYLRDYRPPDYLIDTVFLDFQLGEANTEDVQFHAVDSQGRREAIAKGWLSDNPGVRTDQFRIFSGSAGQTDLYDINCRIVTKSYYVGTLNDLDAKVGMIDIEQYFRSNPALCPPLEQ